jgi:hypothetical protein
VEVLFCNLAESDVERKRRRRRRKRESMDLQFCIKKRLNSCVLKVVLIKIMQKIRL